jgi:hypothetical protein
MPSKFERMARTLPGFYKAETNTMIRGLLQAWGLSDDEIDIQIKNTKSQLFVDEAEGRYLDYLGNNVGVPRDPDLGLGDDDFRNLIPVLSFFPKQVRQTIIALLDVFWGQGFTRPNVNSGNVETYNFGPASVLTGTASFVKGDNRVKGVGTSFTTELNPGDYIKVATASGYTYQKVSAIFNNTLLELSTPWNSPVAVNVAVSKGVIRELSYSSDSREERTIRFTPNAFANITAVTVDELVAFINASPEHSKFITASKYLDPIAGNRLNIRTNTAGLLGAIQVTGGDANSPARLNFSLTKQTDVRCSVFEVNPNEIVVKIPSSVPVLRRSLLGSAHPKQTKTEIFSSEEVFDFSTLGPTSTLTLTVDSSPFTVNFNHASDFADPTRVLAEEIVDVINAQVPFLEAFTATRDQYKTVGLRTSAGAAEYQITGGTANTLLAFATSLQEDPDLILSNYPSAYIFDPVGQLFTVTGTSTELASNISAGSIQPSISLSNAASFPNQPGKILLNFGRSEQEGPIQYNARPNNSTLLIDASYTFQNQHVAGRKVNLISDQPTIPRATGADYPVYVVGTEEARAAAQKLIRQLLAAGVVIRFIIAFPEALFECVCRDCGPPELASYQGARTGQGPLVF